MPKMKTNKAAAKRFRVTWIGSRQAPQGRRQPGDAGEVAQAPPPPAQERHGRLDHAEAREAASALRLKDEPCPAQKEDSRPAAAATAF